MEECPLTYAIGEGNEVVQKPRPRSADQGFPVVFNGQQMWHIVLDGTFPVEL